MAAPEQKILLPDTTSVSSFDGYARRGGGIGYRKALGLAPDAIIDEVARAALRGRGGAGFPTGRKWRSVRDSPARTKFVCCNAAEGEPGTFKDRYLLRKNPYQVIEGLAIAALAVGARQAYFGMKGAFEAELAPVARAIDEWRPHLSDRLAIELVLGPDEYLFGEEKALLEVIEGGLPLPRVFPPYLHGLFGAAYAGPSDVDNNPTVVNNVETLANVPHIIENGADWFRSYGSDESPGTMVFTVSGSVRRPTVEELPLGLTLRELIHGVAGGPPEGEHVKAVSPGVANVVITERQLDTPLGFDSMRAAGSALGSAGFIVFSDAQCMVKAAHIFSRFLFVESCNQCAPCKLGSSEITQALERVLLGTGAEHDLERIAETATWVTNGQRCYLATSESLVVSSILAAFPGEFHDHIAGACRRNHDFAVPKMIDFVEGEGFIYDELYARKQPDWTYAVPVPAATRR